MEYPLKEGKYVSFTAARTTAVPGIAAGYGGNSRAIRVTWQGIRSSRLRIVFRLHWRVVWGNVKLHELGNTRYVATNPGQLHWAKRLRHRDVIALINYDNQNYGQPVKWNTTTAQNDLESYNRNNLTGNPGGISQWGYATSSYAWPNGSNGTWTYNHPINWWAGKANISTDYGTDPRSIAWMAWNYSLPNHFFHDWIYRQDMEGAAGANLSYQDQVLHATTKLGVALEQTGEIVSVGINGGMHQVIVSGLWSGNDPIQNFPAQIQGLVYRDPEGSTWNSPLSASFLKCGRHTDA